MLKRHLLYSRLQMTVKVADRGRGTEESAFGVRSGGATDNEVNGSKKVQKQREKRKKKTKNKEKDLNPQRVRLPPSPSASLCAGSH